MTRMGERLVEAMQELLDYSEGKNELKTSCISISPECEAMNYVEAKKARENLKDPKFQEEQGMLQRG